jgi:hypothetical protein
MAVDGELVAVMRRVVGNRVVHVINPLLHAGYSRRSAALIGRG